MFKVVGSYDQPEGLAIELKWKFPHGANGTAYITKSPYFATQADLYAYYIAFGFEYLTGTWNDFLKNIHEIRQHWFHTEAQPYFPEGYEWRANFLRLVSLKETLSGMVKSQEYNYCKTLSTELSWIENMIPPFAILRRTEMMEQFADIKTLVSTLMQKIECHHNGQYPQITKTNAA